MSLTLYKPSDPLLKLSNKLPKHYQIVEITSLDGVRNRIGLYDNEFSQFKKLFNIAGYNLGWSGWEIISDEMRSL